MLDLRLSLDACCNHLGCKPLVEEMIIQASRLGAWAIKFQLFNHFKLNTQYPNYEEVKNNMIRDQINSDMLHLIFDECGNNEIIPMFTIFSEDRISILDDFKNNDFIIKIASPDFTNRILVKLIIDAFPGKLIIISTGMSTNQEITFYRKLYNELCPNLKFLYCISKYPTFPSDICLNDLLGFDGFSDHTADTGMTKAIINQLFDSDRFFILEKHFTLSKYLPGKDQKISMDVEDVMDIMSFYNYQKNNFLYKRRFIQS